MLSYSLFTKTMDLKKVKRSSANRYKNLDLNTSLLQNRHLTSTDESRLNNAYLDLSIRKRGSIGRSSTLKILFWPCGI